MCRSYQVFLGILSISGLIAGIAVFLRAQIGGNKTWQNKNRIEVSCLVNENTQTDKSPCNAPEMTAHWIKSGNRIIYVVSAGNPSSQPVIFVHGSPGNWMLWEEYLKRPELKNNFYLISYDRPGYGASKPSGATTAKLDEQANIMADILRSLASARPALVVAHSYGGAVAIDFALKQADLVKSLILLAPALDPDREEHFYYYFLNHPLVPGPLSASARESVPLPNELRRMEANLDGIKKIPIRIFQGNMDIVVDRGTPQFFYNKAGADQSAITLEPKIPWQGHNIPTDCPNLVAKAILGSQHASELEMQTDCGK